MILCIPYYSQYCDVFDTEWQTRSCGVVCLKMLLEARGVATPPIDEMIQDGVAIGAYSENGWIHNGLVALGTNYGCNLYRKEFRKKDADFEIAEKLNDEGIEEITDTILSEYPVIVSAVKNFEIRDKFHMVIVVGVEIKDGVVKGFYYHDPDCIEYEKGKNLFVPIDIFRANWRRMAIFIQN